LGKIAREIPGASTSRPAASSTKPPAPWFCAGRRHGLPENRFPQHVGAQGADGRPFCCGNRSRRRNADLRTI